MPDDDIRRPEPKLFNNLREVWLWAIGHQDGDDTQHIALNKSLNNIERLLSMIAIGVIGTLVMTILGIILRASKL